MCTCGEKCKCKEKLHPTKVHELLKEVGGKFMSVTFVKKDGSTRVLNGRFGVKKGVKGTAKSAAANRTNPYVVVWDAQAKNFRMVNMSTIKEVCACGKRYKVE